MSTYEVVVTPLLSVTQVMPPSEDRCTAYDVTALPPLSTGAPQLTVTCRSPGLAVTVVGEPGTVAGVAPAVALGDPVPPLLIADTRNP